MTEELFIRRLFTEEQAARFTLRDVLVEHEVGTVTVLVEDRESTPLSEGEMPVSESIPKK